jgi:hypothetical protein
MRGVSGPGAADTRFDRPLGVSQSVSGCLALDDVARALTVVGPARTPSKEAETPVTPRKAILLILGAPSEAQTDAWVVVRHHPTDLRRAA